MADGIDRGRCALTVEHARLPRNPLPSKGFRRVALEGMRTPDPLTAGRSLCLRRQTGVAHAREGVSVARLLDSVGSRTLACGAIPLPRYLVRDPVTSCDWTRE